MNFSPTTYILDNNILVRLADANSSDHGLALEATKILRASGATLRTIPQTIFEFWVVSTRPQNKNGLGLSVEDADSLISFLSDLYPTLLDSPLLFNYWRSLVKQYRVVGKQAHDARYIAAMQAHRITHILTFDSDFNRYKSEGITVVNPNSVVAPAEN